MILLQAPSRVNNNSVLTSLRLVGFLISLCGLSVTLGLESRKETPLKLLSGQVKDC